MILDELDEWIEVGLWIGELYLGDAVNDGGKIVIRRAGTFGMQREVCEQWEKEWSKFVEGRLVRWRPQAAPAGLEQ